MAPSPEQSSTSRFVSSLLPSSLAQAPVSERTGKLVRKEPRRTTSQVAKSLAQDSPKGRLDAAISESKRLSDSVTALQRKAAASAEKERLLRQQLAEEQERQQEFIDEISLTKEQHQTVQAQIPTLQEEIKKQESTKDTTATTKILPQASPKRQKRDGTDPTTVPMDLDDLPDDELEVKLNDLEAKKRDVDREFSDYPR